MERIISLRSGRTQLPESAVAIRRKAPGQVMSQTLDDELWRSYFDAEVRLVACRLALVQDRRVLDESVAQALKDPVQRGAALRLLLGLPFDVSRPHLSQLVRLAAVGHTDVAACREIVRRLPGAAAEISAVLDDVLKEGGEEEYRRIAELCDGFDEELLMAHLGRCLAHADAEIKEIAHDFSVALRKA